MDIYIRRYLYDRSPFLPLYNPVGDQEVSFPTILDLTWDISCHTGIYHDQIPETRELLSKADAVVCDNPALATVVSRFAKQAVVASFMFGFCTAQDVEQDGITVGLLNHNSLMQPVTHDFLKIAKKMKYKTLLFGGETPDNSEQFEVVEDLNAFASRCDVLLLPAFPHTINSVTIPLSVMMAGTIVVAANEGGYSSLSGATGVSLINRENGNTLAPWKNAMKYLEQRDFTGLKKFNQNWAKQTASTECRHPAIAEAKPANQLC